ncbi:hypothetical protein [Brevibacterium sp. UCMA 11754]|uniref:hypothetical protein n=1 Tax=Brevibacterium sp. UCMA 11754 TaxID=2749198 RepID=UPI003FA4AB8D
MVVNAPTSNIISAAELTRPTSSGPHATSARQHLAQGGGVEAFEVHGRGSSTRRLLASSDSAASAVSWPSVRRHSACVWSATTPTSRRHAPRRWASRSSTCRALGRVRLRHRPHAQDS